MLATDRRLGAYSPAWTVKATDPPTDYEFTVLELRLDAKGGEGKASLTTKIVADNETKQFGSRTTHRRRQSCRTSRSPRMTAWPIDGLAGSGGAEMTLAFRRMVAGV